MSEGVIAVLLTFLNGVGVLLGVTECPLQTKCRFLGEGGREGWLQLAYAASVFINWCI